MKKIKFNNPITKLYLFMGTLLAISIGGYRVTSKLEKAENNYESTKIYETDSEDNDIKVENLTAIDELEENVNEGDTKVFEPYEHLFFVRINLLTDYSYAEEKTGGSINVPDGYKILEIENYTMRDGAGSQTGGVDIWFTNEGSVEVTAIFNESLNKYDYSHFGTPIEVKENKESFQKIKN